MALTACGLIFVAQLPRLARESWLDPTIGLDARLAGAFFAWMVAMPLLLYAIALLAHIALRLVRWRDRLCMPGGAFLGAARFHAGMAPVRTGCRPCPGPAL